MDIVAHLADLLKETNEIGLEGIGTFRKKKEPGKYNVNEGSFTPPKYTLQFNEDVIESEVLLSTLSEKYSLTNDAAAAAINHWSEQILERLSKHETVILKDIGQFTWNNGHVLFAPDADLNLGNAFFGYPEVVDRPHNIEINENSDVEVPSSFADESPTATNEENREVFENVVEDVAQPSPLTQKFDAEVDQNEFIHDDDLQDDEPAHQPITEELLPEEEYGGNRPAYIKWILIVFFLVLAVGILYMAKPDLFDRFKTNISSVPFNSDSLKSSADTISTDSALVNTVITTVNDSVKNAALTDSSTYEIVVTAVKSEKEIERLSSRYNKMGFEAKVLPGKILKKISVATFTSEQEARDSLKAVQQRLKNKEIYIYYNKKK